MLAGPRDARLADRHEVLGVLGHRKTLAVDQLVLKEDDRVRIADRGFEQPFVIGPGIGSDDLESRHMRVPARIALRMLRRDARGDAVRAAKHDRRRHLTARHIARLRRRVDDLVHRLHGEIERHELDDRPESGKRRADPEPGETMLGDRRVDHAARPEFLQQTLADFVGALVLADLLAEQQHAVVAPHLLGHCIAQRLAHRHRDGFPRIFLGEAGRCALRSRPPLGASRLRRRPRDRRWRRRLGALVRRLRRRPARLRPRARTRAMRISGRMPEPTAVRHRPRRHPRHFRQSARSAY